MSCDRCDTLLATLEAERRAMNEANEIARRLQEALRGQVETLREELRKVRE